MVDSAELVSASRCVRSVRTAIAAARACRSVDSPGASALRRNETFFHPPFCLSLWVTAHLDELAGGANRQGDPIGFNRITWRRAGRAERDRAIGKAGIHLRAEGDLAGAGIRDPELAAVEEFHFGGFCTGRRLRAGFHLTPIIEEAE
jgi:hypothetical protein